MLGGKGIKVEMLKKKNTYSGGIFCLTAKRPLDMPISMSECLGFNPISTSDSNFLLMCILGNGR